MDIIERAALKRDYEADEVEEKRKQKYYVTIKEIEVYRYEVYETCEKDAEIEAEYRHNEYNEVLKSCAHLDSEYEVDVEKANLIAGE